MASFNLNAPLTGYFDVWIEVDDEVLEEICADPKNPTKAEIGKILAEEKYSDYERSAEADGTPEFDIEMSDCISIDQE